MKRIVFLFIVLSISLSLVACGNIEYDEDELKEKAKELIYTSAVLDEIFWGAGIDYVNDLSFSNGIYYMASEISLNKYGIRTVYDLEVLTRATLSERYANSALQSALGGANDGEFVFVLARYYQKYSDIEQKEPVCIMVNSSYKPLLTDTVDYLYDTIKVLSSDKERIYLTIDVNVTRDKSTQRQTLDIALTIENGEYKIDSPTYTTYIETEK